MVAKKPSFKGIWRELANHLRGVRFLVAHNAGFDRNVFEQCCMHYEILPPSLPWRCSLQLARCTWNFASYRLPDLSRALKIQLKHHDALSDARACARIVIAASKERTTNQAAASNTWHKSKGKQDLGSMTSGYYAGEEKLEISKMTKSWQYFHRPGAKTTNTGKYLFFSLSRPLLEYIAKQELLEHGFSDAKISSLPDRHGDFVLCLYYRDHSKVFELEKRNRGNKLVRYRYWKPNEDTEKGIYSEAFFRSRIQIHSKAPDEKSHENWLRR